MEYFFALINNKINQPYSAKNNFPHGHSTLLLRGFKKKSMQKTITESKKT